MILDALEVHLKTDEFTCKKWNYFFKLLYWSESNANLKQNSVTIMWWKYHVMMVYFLSQLHRWMVMIRSAREWEDESKQKRMPDVHY